MRQVWESLRALLETGHLREAFLGGGTFELSTEGKKEKKRNSGMGAKNARALRWELPVKQSHKSKAGKLEARAEGSWQGRETGFYPKSLAMAIRPTVIRPVSFTKYGEGADSPMAHEKDCNLNRFIILICSLFFMTLGDFEGLLL